MAHCHLIKYHSCFDREALIESLVSFIKLCVIVVSSLSPHSLLLLCMLSVESSVTKRGGAAVLRKRKKGKAKIKNKRQSEREPDREREGEIAKRDRCGERAFRGYLVIGFIIQVCDFNFPLFLSKAGGGAGRRLVVSWITAYEMSCSAPSQCLDDIIGMEMCREEQSIQSLTATSSFNQQKPTIMRCLQNPFFDIISLFPQKSLFPQSIFNHTPRKTICLCKALKKYCR